MHDNNPDTTCLQSINFYSSSIIVLEIFTPPIALLYVRYYDIMTFSGLTVLASDTNCIRPVTLYHVLTII